MRGNVGEIAVADPVDVAQTDAGRRQRLARADDHARRPRIERDDIERLRGGDAEAAALADRVVEDAGVAAEHAAVDMDDVAGLGGARQQPLDHLAVVAGGDEADVLAVGLVGDGEAEFVRERAHLRLRQAAEREAQHRELLARRREEEIALVALGIGGAVERPAALPVVVGDDIVAGRQHVGAEVLGGLEQIGELHVLVAGDAGDRRLAGDIGAGERLDHLFAKARLVIEHVMGNAEPRGDVARVVDVLPGAAGAFAVGRRAMVVKLHRDADDVVALARQQRRDDARSRRRPTSRRRRACRQAPSAARGC